MRSTGWVELPPTFGRRQLPSWITTLLCVAVGAATEWPESVPLIVSAIHQSVVPLVFCAGTNASAASHPVPAWVSPWKLFWYWLGLSNDAPQNCVGAGGGGGGGGGGTGVHAAATTSTAATASLLTIWAFFPLRLPGSDRGYTGVYRS
jgi:hypothetical protein